MRPSLFTILALAACDPIGDEREIAALIALQDAAETTALLDGSQTLCGNAVTVDEETWGSQTGDCAVWLPWSDAAWVEHDYDWWASYGAVGETAWTVLAMDRSGRVTIEGLGDDLDVQIDAASGSWSASVTPHPTDPLLTTHRCELTLALSYPALPGGPYEAEVTMSHETVFWDEDITYRWDVRPEGGEACSGSGTNAVWGPLCSR